MNTYFNYQAQLRSLDLSRAISIPKGVGPFTGFGSADFIRATGSTGASSSYNISLKPEYYSQKNSPKVEGFLPNYSFLTPLIRDIQRHHNTLMNEQLALNLDASQYQETLENNVTFGLITRDGFICINNKSDWSIPISNYTGSSAPKEVVVFARHNYVAEAIDNPVTLEAYAINYRISTLDTDAGSSSNYSDINSFYDLYRRSMDIYYGQNNPTPDFGQHNPLSNENTLGVRLSYYDLIEYVKSKVTEVDYDSENLTLIGIYGKGTFSDDSSQNSEEYFSIVPYEGRWPMDLPFNTAVLSDITHNFQDTKKNLEGFPYSVPNTSDSNLQGMTIMEYINYKIEEVKASRADPIPSGIICLWEQSTIPKGWHEYEKAQGRIVIGFKSGGIKAGPDGDEILAELGTTYLDSSQASDWQINITAKNLPMHLHALALVCVSWDGEGRTLDNPMVGDWKLYDPALVNGGPSTGNTNVVNNTWKPLGMKNGSIKTGPNLTQTDSATGVSSSNLQKNSSSNLQKILPSITLMYIQKD